MSLAVSGKIRTQSTEMMKEVVFFFLIACQHVITFLHDPGSQPCRVLRECRASRRTPGCCVCIVPQSCVTPGSSCPVVTCSTTHLPPSPRTPFHLMRGSSDIHTSKPQCFNCISLSIIEHESCCRSEKLCFLYC